MRKKRFVSGIVCGAFCMLLLAAADTIQAQSPKILKIGNTVPMKSTAGIQIKKWLDLLAERLNASGGLTVKGERYDVQIISYDDEYSADAGRACAERLIYQDGVKHIVCQWGSAPILATLNVAEPNKVLMVCDGATEETMDPKWHYVYRSPSLFWINGAFLEYLEEFKRRGFPMTVVQINPDDTTGRAAAKRRAMLYENVGVRIIEDLFYKRGTTDYTPFATKIKSLNPGFVDTGTTPGGPPTLLLAKALFEVGYKGGKIFNNMATTWSEIADKVDPSAVEGAVGLFRDPRAYRTEKWVLDLCEAYEKKYGVWETDAVNWISGWFFLIAAIKKADSIEVEDLVKALDGLEVDCLDCRQRLVARRDKNNPRACDAVPEQIPGIVRDGKFQVMKRMSIEENFRLCLKGYKMEEIYEVRP